MRISQIFVRNLFGVFDHLIPMKMEDRITIIHGPNGFGKTAILRLIDGLFNSKYSELRTIPFKEFRVAFDDGSLLKVLKTTGQKQDEVSSTSPRITVAYNKGGVDEESFVLKRFDKGVELGFPIGAIDDFIPELDRIAPRLWRYIPTNETLSLEDVLERFADALPVETPKIKSEPSWFKAIRQAINVRLVQTQRLLTLSTSQKARKYGHSQLMTAVVTEYSTELAKAIQSKLGEYATLSQSLDRTFPARLVKEEVPIDLTFENLTGQLSELEEKRNGLSAAGLLDKEKDVEFQVPQIIDDRTKGVLSVYIKDVQEKLSIFDEMAARIDLFKKIINERFKYKEMTITKENGITFKTYDNVPLSPTSLSSGEQHELVLLYEFLFKVKPDSLILIDEPEISLHIAWQEQFLRDLQQITNLASFDVLIATHSPQIIYDRWDLTVELKGPAENGRKQRNDKLEPATATASAISTD